MKIRETSQNVGKLYPADESARSSCDPKSFDYCFSLSERLNATLIS